jgi:hypothetical protein
MKLNNFLIYFKAKKRSKSLNQNPSWANEDLKTCEKNMGFFFLNAKFWELNQRIEGKQQIRQKKSTMQKQKSAMATIIHKVK